MAAYALIKLLHVLGACVLLGTGAGIAFFMLMSYLHADRQAMMVTARHVVLADWVFTTPAVLLQFATGLWLVMQLGIPWDSQWLVSVLGLFFFIGALWLPVVFIQIRVRDRLMAGASVASCRALMRCWIALGIPAFIAVLVLLYLMLGKSGMGVSIWQ